ncbi:MAG: hypothetical protein ACM3TR_16975, partial [Caulobacteraceae bacterium]
MKKSLVLVLAMLLILSVALTACGPKSPATPAAPTEQPKDVQELTVNLFQENSTMDWQGMSSTGEIQIYNWVMEG